MHWASKYIGLPHRPGGRGPDAFDCWGIVCLVYANEYGILLPELPGISAQSAMLLHSAIQDGIAGGWEEVEKPFEGCVVAMSQSRAMHHVGIYVATSGGKVVHCWQRQSVIADSFRALWLKGFRTIKFYRHAEWPT